RHQAVHGQPRRLTRVYGSARPGRGRRRDGAVDGRARGRLPPGAESANVRGREAAAGEAVNPLVTRILREQRTVALPLVLALLANVFVYMFAVRPRAVKAAGAADRAAAA